jgi:protein-disulfide isomerase/uncharacterized membrane protein
MPPAIKPEKNNPLPYHYYTLPVLLFLLLALANTGYLAWAHYQNYTNLAFSSFCALSPSFNCDTVSQSPWSILFGLPLAYWGFFAYGLFLLIFIAACKQKNDSKQLWSILCVIGLFYAVAAVSFGYISATKIRTHCLLCLTSHAVCFALLFSSWIIYRRFCSGSYSTALTGGLRHISNSQFLKVGILSLLLGIICTRIFLPPYWQYELPPIADMTSHGLTEEGHPWIGSKNSAITIHEYADYQCFQCGKAHQFLRRLIAGHPGKIMLIHHHYPMDHEFNEVVVPEPFHIGAGKMAMVAIYAASKDKFWEMNDALYAIGRQKAPFSTRTLAETTGFSSGELAEASRNPVIKEVLLQDIRQGMKLGIVGTPTFVIDGKVYSGALPADILKEIMQ